MTKQKSISLDHKAKQYIIDCIDLDDHDITASDNIYELIQQFRAVFVSEYGWRVDQVGEHKALIDWFQGLPSACHIVFYNFDILKLAESWGSIPKEATEKQEDKILDNYWNFIASKTGQLFRTSETTLNKHYVLGGGS